MSGIQRSEQRGFTIVEMVIVIIVIAILATITIVVYSGIQAGARDAERKNDLSVIADALKIYKADNGDYPKTSSGCRSGSGGGGNGWLNHKYGNPLTVVECLTEGRYLEENIVDPSGSISCSGEDCHAYMIYSCSSGTWVMANLETEPQNSSATDGKCASSWDTSYGINYTVQVE